MRHSHIHPSQPSRTRIQVDQTAEEEQGRRDAWLVICRLVVGRNLCGMTVALATFTSVSRILTQISSGDSSTPHALLTLRGGGISIIKTHLNACISMPPIRLFLFLANSFTFLPFSQSFLITSDRHIQFCYFRFKTHTMPHSPSSIVDFVDDNSQDGANIDTRAFPSDPSSSNTGTARVVQETDDLIRVAVLGTGMMGQVGIRVCNC